MISPVDPWKGVCFDMNLLGIVKDVDYQNFSVTLKLSFIDLDQLSELDKLQKEKKLTKIRINSRNKSNVSVRTLPQHRKWFVLVREVLKKSDIEVTPYTMKLMHEELKKSFFPIRIVQLGDKEFPIIPSINDLTVPELGEAITKLIETYSLLDLVDVEDNL